MKTDEHRFVYQHFRFPTVWHNVISLADSIIGRHGEAFHFQRGTSQWTPMPRGGYTRCYVYDQDYLMATGLAECSPRDSFCYKIGRDISRGRALKALKRVLEGVSNG
jgi:hypothetical protein